MKRSGWWMFAFWGVLFVFGLLDNYYLTGTHAQAYFISSLLITTAFLFAWFLADAKDSNHNPSYGLKIGVVALGFIAVPYYLIRYKGWQRALISFAKFLGFLLVYFGYLIALEYLLDTNI